MTTQSLTQTYVRWMIRRDLPEVLAIEAENGPPVPGSLMEERFLRFNRGRSNIPLISEMKEVITGFCLYTLTPEQLWLRRIAVASAWRFQGMATAMVNKMKKGIRTGAKRTGIVVFVPEENLAAQLFFKSQDFKARGLEDGQIEMVFRV
jgi:ribosomal-protein-alanine N-acetyltransferase